VSVVTGLKGESNGVGCGQTMNRCRTGCQPYFTEFCTPQIPAPTTQKDAHFNHSTQKWMFIFDPPFGRKFQAFHGNIRSYEIRMLKAIYA
jgi:phage terminase large subunit GpA-like protein